MNYFCFWPTFVDSTRRCPYSFFMEQQMPTHEELLKKVADIDPLLVEAINDVDTTLLDEFQKLSFEKKIEWATQTGQALSRFKK